ncbi:hypothetical protein HDV00_008025 [Rhizophlyctis rosea]|nr:hypothetical protein HDV00_008025 [Rhizophlyctis rosea]
MFQQRNDDLAVQTEPELETDAQTAVQLETNAGRMSEKSVEIKPATHSEANITDENSLLPPTHDGDPSKGIEVSDYQGEWEMLRMSLEEGRWLDWVKDPELFITFDENGKGRYSNNGKVSSNGRFEWYHYGDLRGYTSGAEAHNGKLFFDFDPDMETNHYCDFTECQATTFAIAELRVPDGDHLMVKFLMPGETQQVYCGKVKVSSDNGIVGKKRTASAGAELGGSSKKKSREA